MLQSEQTTDLSAALAKAQSSMKAATFNKTNPHFKNKYADLSAVLDAIRKPLADHGLSVTQTTEIRDGGFVLVTTLRHQSGQWIAGEYPLPVAAKPQELGSALTYARRYSLSAIACIAADEDDDAEGARVVGQIASKPAPRNAPKAVEPPVNPETGECSPHLIRGDDPTSWGGSFVAAIKSAKTAAEVDQWSTANEDALTWLENTAPKVHARVKDRINERQSELAQGKAA